jgi:hypothetical protein
MDIHGKYTEVLIRWMESIDSGISPTIFGDGLQTMDFVDVRDVARANILASKAEVNDMVFNIGSGVETSLIDLARLLLRIMGREDLKPQFGIERKVNSVNRRLASLRLPCHLAMGSLIWSIGGVLKPAGLRQPRHYRTGHDTDCTTYSRPRRGRCGEAGDIVGLGLARPRGCSL